MLLSLHKYQIKTTTKQIKLCTLRKCSYTMYTHDNFTTLECKSYNKYINNKDTKNISNK